MTSPRHAVKSVVVILAGSRTGSSFLFHALKAKAKFIAGQGEETPFYKINGIGQVHSVDDSDEITDIPPQTTLNQIGEDLIADAGIGSETLHDPDAFVASVVRRFRLQWPHVFARTNADELAGSVYKNLAELPPAFSDWSKFYLLWLCELKKQHPEISLDPFEPRLQSRFDPPVFIEEPPYIIPYPQQPATTTCLQKHPLLLKSSSNIYRISFLKALFPNAQFRWIVLSRNPAASINALMEAWLSGGFHSHCLAPSPSRVVKIHGYSELQPEGHRYWKLDLPPGWSQWLAATLPEVCAFQWTSAASRLQKFMHTTSDPVHWVQSEKLCFGPDAAAEFQKILQFSGVEEKEKTKSSWDSTQPIVSVTPPALGKWKKRKAEIVPLLVGKQNGGLKAIGEGFNYHLHELDQWV